MAKYWLSAHAVTDAPRPEMTQEQMAEGYARVQQLEEEMRSSGTWVFGGHLHDADTATVVSAQNGEVLTTDGPFVEAKGAPRGFLHNRGRRPRRRP